MKNDKTHKHSISQLFRQAMHDVKPLHPDNKPQVTDPPPPTEPPAQLKQLKKLEIEQTFQKHTTNTCSWEDIPEQVSADSYLYYTKSPLRPKERRQLKQGKIPIQGCLDLHEHTLQTAEPALETFISNALTQGKRYLRIIHGKSRHSEVPPIKNHVNRQLTLHPQVVAFCSCPPQQGGKGAVNVILSSKSRN